MTTFLKSKLTGSLIKPRHSLFRGRGYITRHSSHECSQQREASFPFYLCFLKASNTVDPFRTSSFTLSSAATSFGIRVSTSSTSGFGMTTTPSTESQKTISPYYQKNWLATPLRRPACYSKTYRRYRNSIYGDRYISSTRFRFSSCPDGRCSTCPELQCQKFLAEVVKNVI